MGVKVPVGKLGPPRLAVLFVSLIHFICVLEDIAALYYPLRAQIRFGVPGNFLALVWLWWLLFRIQLALCICRISLGFRPPEVETVTWDPQALRAAWSLPFHIRDLSIHEFWCLWEPRSQYPSCTKGRLYVFWDCLAERDFFFFLCLKSQRLSPVTTRSFMSFFLYSTFFEKWDMPFPKKQS